MVTRGRGGSRPKLGGSTMQFPSDEQIPGANFYGRYMFNSSVTPPFSPFYLPVSKIVSSNRGVRFIFVKDKSAITLKNRLTHHPHSLASLFYKDLRSRHPHLNSRAPWKWRSWAKQCLRTLPHILASKTGHGPVCDPGCAAHRLPKKWLLPQGPHAHCGSGS